MKLACMAREGFYHVLFPWNLFLRDFRVGDSGTELPISMQSSLGAVATTLGLQVGDTLVFQRQQPMGLAPVEPTVVVSG